MRLRRRDLGDVLRFQPNQNPYREGSRPAPVAQLAGGREFTRQISHVTALGHSPRAHPREQPMSTFMGPKAVYFGEPPRLGANLKIRPHGKLLPNCYFPNNL